MNNKTRLSCCNEYYVDLIEPLFFDVDDNDPESGKFSGVFCVRLLTCSAISKSKNTRSKYVYVPSKFVDPDVMNYYKSNFPIFFNTNNDLIYDSVELDESENRKDNNYEKENDSNYDTNIHQATVCGSSFISFNPDYYKEYQEIITRFPNPLKNLKAFSSALNELKGNYFVLQSLLTISKDKAEREL